jgi:hypothetical protein
MSRDVEPRGSVFEVVRCALARLVHPEAGVLDEGDDFAEREQGGLERHGLPEELVAVQKTGATVNGDEHPAVGDEQAPELVKDEGNLGARDVDDRLERRDPRDAGRGQPQRSHVACGELELRVQAARELHHCR